ncbi:MAG: endonuclease III [Clostridia bacterium]
MLKSKVEEILIELNKVYNNPKAALNFSNTFELLVAVVLSAQCTDVRVNKVTSELFKTYNTPEQFAKLTEDELYPLIKSCGLGNSKAKGIIATSKILVEKFNGQVPGDLETLRTLPSVGRKTANVIASVGFGIPAIAVDTHVFRVANRIGLANANNVLKTEMQLQENIPMEMWSLSHHLLIFHGRNVCKAQNPQCDKCTIKNLCEHCDMDKK